jgi:hypothetical protein
MKVRRTVLSVAPFLIMFGVTLAAGGYSAIVSKTEGHGAKGAYGYDFVLIVAFLIVAIVLIAAFAYSKMASRKAKSGR